ncbi:MAG: PLDc N-terminal domain-containing protein [Limisphaerales bacterium]
MDKFLAILLLVAELVAVAAIVHLWNHAPKPSLTSRLLWSVLLMIPVFGLIFYIFLREEPEPHGENKWTDGASGWHG